MTGLVDATGIDRTLVVVPAHNEADGIARCIRSIASAALVALDHGISTHVVVVADTCRDATAEVACAEWRVAGGPAGGLTCIEASPRSAGGARRIGVDVGLASQFDLNRWWVLTTDADSAVPADWIVRQLIWASRGFDAVAGTVRLHELNDVSALSAVGRCRYQRLLAAAVLPGGQHSDVFGANIGVRAETLHRVGRFAPVALGEDHALWGALRTNGCDVVSPLDVVVSTSGRTHGRAPGGLASVLAALDRESA